MKFQIATVALLAGLASALPQRRPGGRPGNKPPSCSPDFPDRPENGTLPGRPAHPINSTRPSPPPSYTPAPIELPVNSTQPIEVPITDAAADGPVGYGEKTTGGAGGAEVTVTSCAELATAVTGDAAKIVKVSGVLDGCGIIDIESNTSVIGEGASSGLAAGGFRIKRVSNVIVQNLKLGPAPAKGDVLAIDQSTNVWIDHNDLKSIGQVGGKDDFDGLCDITHAADMITVSWNTFSDHFKGLLFGHSDSNGAEDTGKLHVSVHHNVFTKINSRNPSVRFGTVHAFNNIYTDVGTSGINSRMGAQVLVENNIFNNVKLAMVTDLDSDEPGNICNKGNVLSASSTTRITSECDLTIPYTYTADATDGLEAILSAGAGADKA